jgi:hypothetical protein
LPSLSFRKGVEASYSIVAGETIVEIVSSSKLDVKAVHVGTGQMVFHWVSTGKTSSWKCDTSMLDPMAVQAEEKVGTDGSQKLEVKLENVFPAGLLLQGRMVGTLIAPAVHVNVPWMRDVWVFLIRSPWFPLKFQLDKPGLFLQHDASTISAALNTSADGSVAAQVILDGADFKKATLAVKRSLGSYSSEEVICEVEGGSQTSVWNPISRDFDLLLVTGEAIGEGELIKLAGGLSANMSHEYFSPGSVEGDFVLCDGPAASYSWVLTGHRGLLENAIDQTAAKFTW